MAGLNLEIWQLVLAGLAYVAYLCFVMFGGMKSKKIKLPMYVVMTALLIYGMIKQFNGIHSVAEVINICGILAIGLIKGIYLGRKKIVEKVDGSWYIHHDGKYVAAWVLFFVFKLIFTQVLSAVSGVEIPLWHMILYFTFYYPWRTANIFIHNPDMRKDVLIKKFQTT